MSLGYAAKLSYREDLGGQVGDPEVFDPHTDAAKKIAQLAGYMRDANRIVAFTGAGISTSVGIPDFRGPQGVWTLQKNGKPLPKLKHGFDVARPSLTHMALVGLHHSGKLSYVISQNVDGLHLRSGIPRSALAELHGNCFKERCTKCRTEFVRDFEMETVGHKRTGRSCETPHCRGRLEDAILDWEDKLPEDELLRSEEEAKAADLILCLGSSLQITPACDLPLKTTRAGGRFVIVNLQATPKDRRADLVIHARCDEVMQVVMQQMNIAVPVYRRLDHVMVSHRQMGPPARGGGIAFSLTVSSTHDTGRSAPCVTGAAAQLCDRSTPQTGNASVLLQARGAPLAIKGTAPSRTTSVKLSLVLDEAMDEDKRHATIEYDMELLDAKAYRAMHRNEDAFSTSRHGSQKFEFFTQEETYDTPHPKISPPTISSSPAQMKRADGPCTGDSSSCVVHSGPLGRTVLKYNKRMKTEK